jgi:hypothetical protein
MTHDVFISYSSKDKTIAYAVCAALEAEKIKCWIAPRDILVSDKWGSVITEAITSSRTMVLIFSENANNSDNVLDELGLAKNIGIKIIPFKIEDILPKGEMDLYLNRTHWLDATNSSMEKHEQELIETVNRLLKTENAEDKKDVIINRDGRYQKMSFIVAALIMMLLVGFVMLEPDATEMSPQDITGNVEGLVLDDQNGEKYIYDLIELLSNDDENVRNDSFAALVEIGEPAIDPLIQALNGDEENQVYIVQVLVEIGEPAIEPLINATKDSNNFNPNAQYSAIQALDMISISLKTPPNLTYSFT